MASLNKVMLIGNLCRDPEVRYTPKGSAVADLSLAVNRTWTDDGGTKREEVTYVDIILWAKLAELAGQYLTKGKSIYIEGRLQLDTWEDKATGQKRSKLRIIGEQMQFLGSKNNSSSNRSHESDEDEEPQQQQRPPGKQTVHPRPIPRPDPNADLPPVSDGMKDEDIPF